MTPEQATRAQHPLWCAEYDKAAPTEHDYHESDPLHVELQCYEVGFSVALERSADYDPDGATTRLIARTRDRVGDGDAEIVLTEAEASALIHVLTKQLANLRLYDGWRRDGMNA